MAKPKRPYERPAILCLSSAVDYDRRAAVIGLNNNVGREPSIADMLYTCICLVAHCSAQLCNSEHPAFHDFRKEVRLALDTPGPATERYVIPLSDEAWATVVGE
jgi:hypothetical protein